MFWYVKSRLLLPTTEEWMTGGNGVHYSNSDEGEDAVGIPTHTLSYTSALIV